jgi:hypothetical protein
MASIKATIFFDRRYWVGTFERVDKEGYSVARHIFGKEPTDPEVYEFVLAHYQELKFGEPREFTLEIKRMNPKRVQREVRREMQRVKETEKPSTFAQDYMREELEKKKLQKKKESSAEKQARKDEQFSLKQQKRKEKHRGH